MASELAAGQISRSQRAAAGALTAVLQFLLQTAFTIALAPIVLRVAGQETLGAFAILIQIIGYLGLVDLGFSAALSRYLAQAHGHPDDGKRFRAVLTTGRTFIVGSTAAYAALIWVVRAWFEELFPLSGSVAADARLGLAVLFCWVLLRSPGVVYSAGLVACQELAAANMIAIASNAIRLALSIALLLAGYGLVGLISAGVVAEGVLIFASRWYFTRRYPERRPGWGIPNQELFREILSFGLQLFLITVAVRLVLYTDNIIVGYLFGAAATSIYYSTQMPTTVGYSLIHRISDNATPAVNELYAKHLFGSLRDAFLRLSRYTMLLALPLAGGLSLLNERVISAWVGPHQYAGHQMTFALAAFAALISMSHVASSFVVATGRIRILTYLAFVEGVSNVVLSLWLGTLLGVAGVMLATLITHFSTTVYLLRRVLREFGIPYWNYLSAGLLPAVPATGIGCGGAYITLLLVPGQGWLPIVGAMATFAFAYIPIAYRFGLDESDRRQLTTVLKHFILRRPG